MAAPQLSSRPNIASTAPAPVAPAGLRGLDGVDGLGVGLLGMAALIGAAVSVHNGALGVVAVVPFLLCVATAFRGGARLASAQAMASGGAMAVGIYRLCRSFRALLLFTAVCGLLRSPGADLALETERWPFLVIAALLVEVGGRAVARRSGLRTALGVSSAYLLVGVYVLLCAPAPHIDVYIAQTEGATMLLAGQNPYAGFFENPYSAAEALQYLGEASPYLSHYPYPPLSLLVSTLSWLRFGDVRVVYLVLHLAVGLCLYALGNRRRAGLGVALLCLHLLFPRGFLVIEQSWTEPLIAAAVAAYALIRERRAEGQGDWRFEAASLFVLLSAKQYSVLFLPILALALPRERARSKILVTAMVAAGLLLLPFVLWGPAEFVDDVLRFQLRQPFRSDALSVPALVAFVTGWKAPGVLSLVAAAAAFMFLRERGPGGTRGILVRAALIYFAFFAFAKQAFCNYYYFVWVLLLLGSLGERTTRSSGLRS